MRFPIVVAFSLVFTSLMHGQQATFSITISAPDSVAMSSKLKIDIACKNVSDHQIPSSKAGFGGPWDYTVDVRLGVSEPVPLTEYSKILQGIDTGESKRTLSPEERRREFRRHVTSGSTIIQFLAPGETQKDEIPVSKLYDLSKPGRYTIQIQRTDPETKLVVKSNSITVTVTP